MGGVSESVFKLGTFSVAGCKPFAGIVIGEEVVALNAFIEASSHLGLPLIGTDSMLNFLASWDFNINALKQLLEGIEPSGLKRLGSVGLETLRLHAPIENPRQVHCTGANYTKHVIELIVSQGIGQVTENMSREKRESIAPKIGDARAEHGVPYAFSVLPGSITGPYDSIAISPQTQQADWELELGVIVGKQCYQVRAEKALDYVAGYTVLNDVTNRDLLYRKDMPGMDWLRAKCSPTYLPMGPFIVPAMFVKDPQKLQITLKHNGEIMQDESTADMIFSVAKQIEYISKHARLLPGDVIATGSPAGNGISRSRFLRVGDVLDGHIEGIGNIRNQCISEEY